VTLRAPDEDSVVGMLWEMGTEGIEVLPGAPGETILLAYFPDEPGLAEAVAGRLAGRAGARVERTAIPDVDWVARFREGFRAFACGGFWIAPAWDIGAAPPEGRRLLVVDPGRAFGTGTHETTRLCLRALEGLAPPLDPDGLVLDIGTGSGVLAVAAALLGWRRVMGIDIDPESVSSAASHARLNHVSIALALGDGGAPFRRRRFSIVLANITSPVLVSRRGEFADLAAPGGTLVLSGALASEVDVVREAYSPFGDVDVLVDGEWAGLVLRCRP
jgi:ribosomal protein L11 methyltransferase